MTKIAKMAQEIGVSVEVMQIVFRLQKNAPDLFEKMASGQIKAHEADAIYRQRKQVKRKKASPIASLHPTNAKDARMQKHGLVRMSALKARSRAWLWPDRVPFGAITLLAGKKGSGKSSLGSEIAAISTTGREWPGTDVKLEPLNTALIVREEDVEVEPRARAEEQGADLTRLFALKPHRPLPWAHVRDRIARMQARDAWLENVIRDHRIRVIISDPITSIIVHESGNALRDELTNFASLLARHDVACIGIAHLVKSWGGTILGTLRGAGQWGEVARSILAVARLEPADPRSPIVFGQVDSNLAAGNVAYLGYRLEPVPLHPERVRLAWLDDVQLPPHISIDDLVKRACTEGKLLSTKTEMVAAVLLDILAGGVTEPATECVRQVKARVRAGDRTIDVVKSTLGITSNKSNGKWYWQLPLPPTPDPRTEQEGEAAQGDKPTRPQGEESEA